MNSLLGGTWALISTIIRTLIGVISNYTYTLVITLATKSHEPFKHCSTLNAKP